MIKIGMKHCSFKENRIIETYLNQDAYLCSIAKEIKEHRYLHAERMLETNAEFKISV